MAATSAEAMTATCSAELNTNSDSASFCSAELKTPIDATSTPGQRPAMVVTRMIAGGKKMNEVRPWVNGKNQPVEQHRRDGNDRRECETPRRRLFDPWPQAGQPEIPGDPRKQKPTPQAFG